MQLTSQNNFFETRFTLLSNYELLMTDSVQHLTQIVINFNIIFADFFCDESISQSLVSSGSLETSAWICLMLIFTNSIIFQIRQNSNPEATAILQERRYRPKSTDISTFGNDV